MAAPNRRQRRQKVKHFPFIITRLKINLKKETVNGFYTDGMPHNTKNRHLQPSHRTTATASALPLASEIFEKWAVRLRGMERLWTTKRKKSFNFGALLQIQCDQIRRNFATLQKI